MKSIKYPNKKAWSKLIQRPVTNQTDLASLVNQIFIEVKNDGDKAILKFSEKYDGVKLESIKVKESDIVNSAKKVSVALRDAIKLAKRNIELFHDAQKEKAQIIETMKGVKCWRESRAIQKVGIYIPGGSAPLFSTVLMLGVPAKLAGCNEIVLCTPPNKNGELHPAILYAAKLIGIKNIYAVGGIQAIGAMTFGTEAIPSVDKIFGPGNQYVTAAKQAAQQYGIAIDMPAGPSEVLVIADESCEPSYVAADLLSQAEHGPDSQVILLTDSAKVAEETIVEIKKQTKNLPRRDTVIKALENSKTIVLSSIGECIAFSNEYAPEHLILAVSNYKKYIKHIVNAGSVFLGNYSCESAGDYASGTNHTLPTNGYARNYSGVSLDSFVKKITFQELSKTGIKNIGPAIELMAEAEELMAHKNAVSIRLKSIAK